MEMLDDVTIVRRCDPVKIYKLHRFGTDFRTEFEWQAAHGWTDVNQRVDQKRFSSVEARSEKQESVATLPVVQLRPTMRDCKEAST